WTAASRSGASRSTLVWARGGGSAALASAVTSRPAPRLTRTVVYIPPPAGRTRPRRPPSLLIRPRGENRVSNRPPAGDDEIADRPDAARLPRRRTVMSLT